MSISTGTGAAYANSALNSISRSDRGPGAQGGPAATSIPDGSKLANLQKSATSVRTLTVDQAPPQQEAYGAKDAFKDLGRVVRDIARSPPSRIFLGVGLVAAGLAMAFTGVGLIPGGLAIVTGLITIKSGFSAAIDETTREDTQAPSQPGHGDREQVPRTPEEEAAHAARKAAYMRDAGFDVDDDESPEPVSPGDDSWMIDEPVAGADHLEPEPDRQARMANPGAGGRNPEAVDPSWFY